MNAVQKITANKNAVLSKLNETVHLLSLHKSYTAKIANIMIDMRKEVFAVFNEKTRVEENRIIPRSPVKILDDILENGLTPEIQLELEAYKELRGKNKKLLIT